LSDLCDDKSYQSLKGQIAVAQNLIGWNAQGEFRCNTGPWVYNQGQSHEVWTAYAWQYKPCGNWYKGDGFAARFHNGWQGQEKPPISTGWVWVP